MSAMSPESTLAGELWISFVAMVRSYSGIGAGQIREEALVQEAENAVTVAMGAARLNLRIDPASGEGVWSRAGGGAAAENGSFRLLPEGCISFGEKTLDLDHAAIDLAAALLAAAKSARGL